MEGDSWKVIRDVHIWEGATDPTRRANGDGAPRVAMAAGCLLLSVRPFELLLLPAANDGASLRRPPGVPSRRRSLLHVVRCVPCFRATHACQRPHRRPAVTYH